ncbi:MAG: cobalt ECF transporter T component CbiQ [Methanomicrobiales archaeon]|nr:cobalt ECF transporter T component CbiQ [Methanomicrobiales archaeon]
MFAHDFLEEAAQNNALLQIHPHTKLFLGLGTIFLVLFAPHFLIPFIASLVLSITIVFIAKINLKFYLSLLSIPLGFATLSVLVVILLSKGQEPIWSWQVLSWLPLSISQESLNRGLLIFFRIMGGMSALFFISLTTPMTDLFGVMKQLKVPDLFIDLSMIIYRFIFIFIKKAHDIYLAQQMRMGYSKPKEAVKSYSMLFGSIFITSWDAGEQFINAMECRCYNGKYPKNVSYNPVEWRSLTPVILFLISIIISSMLASGYQG